MRRECICCHFFADVNTKDCLLIDFCDPDPCVNGGACVPMTNDYRCDCQNGYSGKNCQHNTDDCASDPCQNGGKCVDGLTRFDCECATGYQGEFLCKTINSMLIVISIYYVQLPSGHYIMGDNTLDNRIGVNSVCF